MDTMNEANMHFTARQFNASFLRNVYKLYQENQINSFKSYTVSLYCMWQKAAWVLEQVLSVLLTVLTWRVGWVHLYANETVLIYMHLQDNYASYLHCQV